MAPSQAVIAESNPHSPAPHAAMPEALPSVIPSADAQSVLSDTPLTDEAREQAAYRAGCAMKRHYEEYQRTGNLKCLDMAHEAMGIQIRLLAGRNLKEQA